MITSLDADGFTADSHPRVNSLGDVVHWIAFGDVDEGFVDGDSADVNQASTHFFVAWGQIPEAVPSFSTGGLVLLGLVMTGMVIGVPWRSATRSLG
jgi:hypothetical protein